MNHATRFAGCLLSAVAMTTLATVFTACQTTPPSSTDMRYHPPAPQAVQVATVAYVNDTAGFVLLEATPGYDPVPGTELVTIRGETVGSNLKVAEHRKPPFIVADIVDRAPPVGLSVFLLPE